MDRYVDALVKEWKATEERLQLASAGIATLYIGGGTPSILQTRHWDILGESLFRRLNTTPETECTAECNPESFSESKATKWLEQGINRLSIGVQSLQDRELRILGRIHTGEEARSVLASRLLEKFASVGVDVMFGIPGQSRGSLAHTLDELCSVPVIRHISAYELTLHESTRLYKHRKILPLPSEEQTSQMFETVHDVLMGGGFQHYEVSNYARPGFRSRHNQAYWNHRPYIGLGPSAHSFYGGKRWANVSDITEYVRLVEAGQRPVGFEEELTTKQLAEEMVFLRLRTSDGLDQNEFERKTGMSFYCDHRQERLDEFVQEGLLRRQGTTWLPTLKGMLFADGMARRLF